MPKWLALATGIQSQVPGSKPVEDGIHLMTVCCFIAQCLLLSPLHSRLGMTSVMLKEV